MSDPYVGEIRMFAGNFAPQGWSLCNGQLLSISDNDALFALIGTTYGGDGQTTFALPDLRGRLPLHMGQGPGLSQRNLGSAGGVEQVALTPDQLPAHNHGPFQAASDAANQPAPQNNVPAQTSGRNYAKSAAPVNLSSQMVTSVGGSQPHDNLMPYLCVNFIISLFGTYPSRS